MRPCTNRPDNTVMKYMPSFSPRCAGSCMSRIFPATRNTMPKGKYLQEREQDVTNIISSSFVIVVLIILPLYHSLNCISWDTKCEPGLIAENQSLSSQMLLWLNGSKSLQTCSSRLMPLIYGVMPTTQWLQCFLDSPHNFVDVMWCYPLSVCICALLIPFTLT